MVNAVEKANGNEALRLMEMIMDLILSDKSKQLGPETIGVIFTTVHFQWAKASGVG